MAEVTAPLTGFNTSNSSLAHDLLLVVPRLAQRAGSFAIQYLPDQLDGFLKQMRMPGSVIAEATVSGPSNVSTANSTAALLGSKASATLGTAQAVETAAASIPASFFSLANLKSLTSFGNYVISRWALTTFFVAIALNRTQVYASARVPLRFNFFLRAIIYSVPIATLFVQVQSLLQAIRCQTSPNWSSLRYGNATKHYPYDYAGGGGFLHRTTSSVLFWESEKTSCQAVDMVATEAGHKLSGSLSLLWPLFLSFCTSQFIETIAAALQGRQPVAETSIFEQSLAFAEAEALVTKPFDLAIISGKADPSLTIAKLNKMKMSMNVTAEVLLISLISAMSSLTSNILAVFGKRKRYRLVNTAVWGFAYMGAFLWSINRLLYAQDDEPWSFRFPTVFIIGFVPHLLIIFGMAACAVIYGIALLLTALSPPPGQPSPQSLKEKIMAAYRNLQASVYLSSGAPITFHWDDDFYSSLLKAGFTILTTASEAVYLNEGTKVSVANHSWLERDRVEQLSANTGVLFKKTRESIPLELRRPNKSGFSAVDEPDANLAGIRSGFAVERKPRGNDKSGDEFPPPSDTGVGILERHGRWSMAMRFVQGLFWLWVGLSFNSTLYLLSKLGINYRPEWVRKLVGAEEARRKSTAARNSGNSHLDLFVLDDAGNLKLAADPNVDVEAEIRRQKILGQSRFKSTHETEAEIDETLYDWWKKGGWWGEADSSGDYVPANRDEDTTSMISTSVNTNGSESDWVDDDGDESGQRTPTRRDPYGQRGHGTTQDEFLATLNNLLDPKTPEHQQEARMLARNLRGSGIMTRSQHQRKLNLERASILTTSRAFNPDRKQFSADDEERYLEHFILERRAAVLAKNNSTPNSWAGPSSWEFGASGMGSSGPKCVVCQDEPRTILLWPCGCLCLCNECRISMATRNFGNCVCCRTATEAFSRLYVP